MNIVEIISQNVTVKTVKKGTILQSKGDEVIKAFYVNKGLLKSYFIDSSGREYIFMFASEGWFLTDVEIMGNKKEATLFIEAIEDSEIQIINEKLFSMGPLLADEILAEQIIRLIKRINLLQRRIISIMVDSTEEKYLDFMKTYPHLLGRVTQTMIASYIGVTPEALSKVKKNIL